jgi:hypothetical protein
MMLPSKVWGITDSAKLFSLFAMRGVVVRPDAHVALFRPDAHVDPVQVHAVNVR